MAEPAPAFWRLERHPRLYLGMARQARGRSGNWQPATAAPAGASDVYIDLSSPCSGTPFRQRGTDGGAGGRPVALLSSSATPCDMSRSVVSLLVHQSDNVNVTSSVNASRASDTVDGDVVSPPVPTASMPSTRVVQPSRSLIISPTKRQTDGGVLMALSDANEPSVTNSPRAALMPERDVVSLFPSDAQTPTSILSRATPASPPRPAPASSSRSAHSAACDLSRSIGHLSDNITFSIGAECAWDGVAGVVPPPHPLPALARPSTSVSLSSSSPRQRVGALSPQCVSSRSPLAVSSSFESQVCGALAPSCDMSQPSPSYGEATSAVANSISSASASCAAFDTYLAALLHVWVGRAECVVLENFDLSLEAATRFTAALPFVSAESLSAPARASAGAGDFFVETALIHAIAQRFDCQAMPTGGTDGAALVALVLHLARSLAAGASFRLVCGCSVDYDSARRRRACHCLSIIGAATSLCETLWLPPPLSTSLRLMCGEWSAASIAECYRTHPRCSLVVAERGWPLPPRYALPLPPTLEEQLYQRRRGRGDGRRVVGVVPLQRQSEDSRLSDRLPLLDEWCDFNSLTQCGLALVFVAICHVPLVYAALDGVRVIGAEFDDTFSRSSA